MFVGKTTNLYEIPPEHYKSLLKNSLTKTHRKTKLITKSELIKNKKTLKTFEIRQ